MKKRVLAVLAVLVMAVSLTACGGSTDKEKVTFVLDWTPNTKGIRIRDKLFLEYGDRFVWPDKDVDVISEKVFCYGLKDHFGILCDGTVVPCCLDSEGEITLGNIFDTPILDIMNSERATLIREGFKRRCGVEELCKKCGYATRFAKNRL